MISHESYYTSINQTASALPPQSPGNTGPPPPPPPKSHDPSRTSTPTVPPIPPHPRTPQPQQPQYQASPAPPHPSQSPSHTSYHGQMQGQYQQGPQGQPQAQGSAGYNNSIASIPNIDSGWLPEGLKEHSTADLQPLLNNPELLDALAKQHPSYDASLEPIQAAISSNLVLAQQVSQLEAQVSQLRDQTGQLLLNHTSLQTQWRRKQSEMDDALSSWGPRAMYSRLVSSINEQESLLSAVHDSFVEGGHEGGLSGDGKATEKEVTEWIKRIREGTSTLEKRREMRQRWDEGRVGGWR